MAVKKKKLGPGTMVARETAVQWSSFAQAPDEAERVTAAEFKTHCLRLIEEVRQGNREVVITRYGTPVARLVPYSEGARSLFGALRGTVVSHGDLIAPIDEAWEADA
jgi:prevent-host-death family protein